MNDIFLPFIWVAVTLPVLLVMQRWIHKHLRGLALLLTGNMRWAIIVYAIILFPGVLLHEFSHWIVAGMLGVRTGKFSVLPQHGDDGSVQLGYVEYYKDSRVGPVRESLIGAAPFFFGTGVILLISHFVFDLPQLIILIQTGDVDSLLLSLRTFLATNDVFVWLYLLFAVSNAMMPSPSDRRSWPPVLIALGVIIVLLVVFDVQPLLTEGVLNPLSIGASYLALAFGFTIVIDVLFIAFIFLLELIIGRIRGVRVQYQ
ncbi:MAG: hypothetical protein M9918_24715 [Anaerolineae bacterium]|nr:hypothetical protein [Anaerolineae bacterium]